MAYVILGRSEDINDLYIAGDFDPKHIKCEPASMIEAERLDLISLQRLAQQRELEKSSIKISYLNVRSLREHYQDVVKDPLLMNSDILGLGETWLHEGETADIPNYYATYVNSGKGKGLSAFCKSGLFTIILQESDASGLFVSHDRLDVVFLYLSHNFKWSTVMEFLENVISPVKATVLMGDLNWHYPDSHPMKKYMKSKGFYQLSRRATHEKGRILDHLYISEHLKETKMAVKQQSSYYSDHDTLKIYVPLQ